MKLYTKATSKASAAFTSRAKRRAFGEGEADAARPTPGRRRAASEWPLTALPYRLRPGGLEGLETARNGEARPQDVVVRPVFAIPTPDTHMLA